MKHLSYTALLIAILFSCQMIAATAEADNGYNPPTGKFSRKIDIPNNAKKYFSTNDDPTNMTSRTSRANRMRQARENRRQHGSQKTTTNNSNDDRTQSESTLSSTDRNQGRRQRTNTYRNAQRNDVTMLRDSVSKGVNAIKNTND